MKFRLLKLLLLCLNIFVSCNFLYSDETIAGNEIKEINIDDLGQNANAKEQSELETAAQLNRLLNKQFEQLESIKGKIQILAQMINKNSIKFSEKDFEVDGKVLDTKSLVKTWLKKKLKAINNKIKYLSNSELNLKKLQNLAKFVEDQIIFILEKIKNKFELTEAEVDEIINKVETTPKEDSNNSDSYTRSLKLRKMNDFIQHNDKLIEILEKETRDAGLTTVNKIFRKLDKINNEHKITSYLNYVPIAITSSLLATYLTPTNYVNKVPFLHRWLNPIKDWIGNPTTLIGKLAAVQNNDGNLGRLLKYSNIIYKDDDARALLFWLSLSSAPFLVKSNLLDSQYPILKKLKENAKELYDKWLNKLKGSNSFSKSTYSYDSAITLDDPRLIGIESQIADLKKIISYITDPEVYDKANCNLEKGILLVGPSRNGKTRAAEALQGTLNELMEKGGKKIRFAFKEIKWGDINWSSEGIKSEIEEAKKHAPCILFIDEIHNIPLQTKEGSGRVLTEFLTGMSGINSENDLYHQVILLAATNHPESLDTALIQPGRFGKVIYFEKPNCQNRKKYFDVHFEYNAIDMTNIDIDSLARQTEGCSYGDLEAITKSARFTARSLAKGVTQKMLQDQINTHVYRLKETSDLTTIEKKHLAAHNAGHALMYELLDPMEKLEFVTIKGKWYKIKEQRFWENNKKAPHKTTKYGMLLTYNNAEALKIENDEEKMKLAKIKLAGNLAEKILYGSSGLASVFKDKSKIGHKQDKQRAFSYIKSIIYDGLDETQMPKAMLKEKNLKAVQILEQCEKETFELLTKNKKLLEIVAHELQVKETLTANDIQAIIKT